jgi:hypothetical protein
MQTCGMMSESGARERVNVESIVESMLKRTFVDLAYLFSFR